MIATSLLQHVHPVSNPNIRFCHQKVVSFKTAIYHIPKSISDTKKTKDTFIGAYTLEKYEGLSRKKINGILSNPKVSA
jgi:hypothetical protein